MTIDNEVQTEEFKALLEELRKQLLEASMHFEIWEVLWPTEQVVDVINRYKGFFLPSRNAHLDRFFIKVCNIVSNKPNQPSFFRVFRMLASDVSLAPGLDVRLLKKRLKPYRITLNAIEDYRNTRGAHWDIDIQAQKKPILFGDCKKMLAELQNIFNEISIVATKNKWSFQPLQHDDTIALLNHLEELRTIHKKRIDATYSKTNS